MQKNTITAFCKASIRVITAAMIEGATLFAVVVGMMAVLK